MSENAYKYTPAEYFATKKFRQHAAMLGRAVENFGISIVSMCAPPLGPGLLCRCGEGRAATGF